MLLARVCSGEGGARCDNGVGGLRRGNGDDSTRCAHGVDRMGSGSGDGVLRLLE